MMSVLSVWKRSAPVERATVRADLSGPGPS